MPRSLIDILQRRAMQSPEKVAYRFLRDGETDESVITYAHLERKAASIAHRLEVMTQPGDRVLLMLPAGLDFIAFFWGCLYAKVIAIPIPAPHPLRLEKTLAHALRIITDATPSVAIAPSALSNAIRSHSMVSKRFADIQFLGAEEGSNEDETTAWERPIISGEDLAFLQYTSGSLASPRGVKISHGNLLHNLDLIRKTFGHSESSRGVIWLPPYHDMGLIGGILQPLFSGFPVTLIPHLMFVQRPIRWLQAIDDFGATTSGGPNFAYELCLRKIKPEQRAKLDLSSWKVAFNGAEPVRHSILKKFTDYFAPSGFRPETFLPCYGLAEATLLVTGGPAGRLPIVKICSRSSLSEGKVVPAGEGSIDSQPLVGCGLNLSDQQVVIVDPATLQPCSSDQVGEIWVSGPSVADGYWNNPVETAAVFKTSFPGEEGKKFLRTGDLGFIRNGELFITGRLKNLIIIDGKNHYPHDIEETVEKAHADIRPAGCAVFSIWSDREEEQVIVIAETSPKTSALTQDIKKNIRMAVADKHALPVRDIKLVRPGAIPRTSSGKVRHFVCREKYLAMTLTENTTP